MSKLKSFGWWRSRLFEVAAALLIAVTVIQLSGTVAERQKELLPAESWFVLNEVYIPDFEQGTNPSMIYDRVILENHDAFWIAEVQRPNASGLWSTVCTGDGVNEYDPSEIIPNNVTDFLWYMNGSCGNLPPGSYRVKTTRTMSRPGWPQKRLFDLSNTFRVLPKGAEVPVCPFCGRGLEAE